MPKFVWIGVDKTTHAIDWLNFFAQNHVAITILGWIDTESDYPEWDNRRDMVFSVDPYSFPEFSRMRKQHGILTTNEYCMRYFECIPLDKRKLLGVKVVSVE